MDLQKLFDMQKTLDERIIKEKGLEGQDLFPNTVLALQVELAEFANEGRWFKHWSNDQEPRISEKCKACEGNGYEPDIFSDDVILCPVCEATGRTGRNPLLEEFVDGVHFFLSIANQKGWQESLYIYEDALFEIEDEGFDGGLTGAFLEMNYWLSKSYMEKSTGDDKDSFEKAAKAIGISKQEFFFKNAWFLFLAIGLVGFKFTPEQIEQAYFEKNAVNHQRQENGY